MAIQPKEFIGIAEGIKNHELSMREKIEVLRGEIYELSRSKRTLDRHIARLEASLDAANNKTNQDGDPDYNRIAEIETEIQENQDLLSQVESLLYDVNGKLSSLEGELEGVLAEKTQTLYEIQERARITSNNISLAGAMCGAYAGVGSSLQASLNINLSSLSQAASILGGSVDAFFDGGTSGGQGHSAAGNSSTTRDLSTSALSAFSTGNSFSGSTGGSASSPSAFESSQIDVATPASMTGFRSSSKTINAQKTLKFNSNQDGNKYAVSAFSGIKSEDGSEQVPSYTSEQLASTFADIFSSNSSAESSNRKIPGTPGRVTGGNARKLGNNAFKEFEPIEDLSEDALIGKSEEEKRIIREAHAFNQAKLEEILKEKKAGTYQRHHIIPCNRDENGVPRPHPVLLKMGIDLDDGSNCIFLQSDRAASSTKSKHYSKHGIYNDIVNEQLDKIDINQSVADIEKQVYALQQKLKSGLESGLPLYPQVASVQKSYSSRKRPNTPVEMRGEGGTEEDLKRIWRKHLERSPRQLADNIDYEFSLGSLLANLKKKGIADSAPVDSSVSNVKSFDDQRNEFIKSLQVNVKTTSDYKKLSTNNSDDDDHYIGARERPRVRQRDASYYDRELDIDSIKNKIASFLRKDTTLEQKALHHSVNPVENAQKLIDNYCHTSLTKVLSESKQAVRLSDTVEFQDEGRFALGLGGPSLAAGVNGYNDGRMSYVKNNGPHPQKTAIHEHNHQLSCNDVKDNLGYIKEYRRGISINGRDTQINEALTEYFTKKMMGAEYPANPDVGYIDNMLRIEKMESAFGEELLKTAYFQNQPQLLKDKYEAVMGKDAWDNLSLAFNESLRPHTAQEVEAIREHYAKTGTRITTQTDAIRKKATDYANRCATLFTIKSKGVE